MSFPFRLVLEFLGRSAAWLAVAAVLAVLVGMGLAAISGSEKTNNWKPLSIGAFTAAVLTASLVHRFDVPAVSFEIWHRPFPPVWTVGGAVAGALIVLVVQRRKRPAG